MSKEVSDGVLVDVRDTDLDTLASQPLHPGIETALDKLLTASAESFNGFDSII